MSTSKSDAESVRRKSIGTRFIESLSRVTSGGKFVPCIDGLRFIAIMAVVLYHLNGYLIAKGTGFSAATAKASLSNELLHGAQCGVQLFFAISGFILALPFAREAIGSGRNVSLKQYYFRRLTRLEPPFLINLAIGVTLIVLVKGQAVSQIAGPLLATMTYTHNWIYGAMSTVNAVAWSLEIEIQFYILAPFLARFYFRSNHRHRRMALTCGICALMFAKTAFIVADATRFRLGLLFALDHFLAGILMADVFVFKWRESPRQGKPWDVLSLVVLPAIFLSQLRSETQHLLPVLTALLFAAALRGPVTNRVLSVPLIVVTGGMCYSIYLYHFFVISLLGRFITPWISGSSYLTQLAITSATIVPAIFFVCAFFFVAIEKPFMKWRPLRNTHPPSRPENGVSDKESQHGYSPVVKKAA